MKKPIGCTYPDCFTCPLDDCTYDREEEILLELEELKSFLAEIKNNSSGSLRNHAMYKRLMNRKNYLERKLNE